MQRTELLLRKHVRPQERSSVGDAAVAYFISKDRQSDRDIRIADVYTESLGNVGKGPDGVRLRPKEDGITMPDGRDVFIHVAAI